MITKPLHLPRGIEELPADWRWSRLDDVCEAVYDCPHSTPMLTNDGPFVVRSQDIRSTVFRVHEAARVSEETYRERVGRAEPRRGDLLYSREGTYFGIAAEVPENVRVCLGQRMVLIRPKADLLNFRYLRFWLNSPSLSQHIHGHRDGTVAERLNLPTIRGLPVAVPPLFRQEAIANVLGTLDDKIELNRQMSETLEAMARAVFRSWFVNFDPVRAKADGRKPDGLDNATAQLLPNKFEDSPLGPVPKGWHVVPLGDHVEVAKGLSYKGEGLAEAGMALHNLNSVYEGGGYKHEGIKHYVGEYRPCHIIRAGDVIVTNTEQGHDHLLIGYSALIPKRYGDLGLFTHHTYRVRPLADSPLTPPFIHYLLLTSRFRGEVIGFTNGTTVNMLPADGLKRPRLVLPPAELIRRFTDFVTPLIDKAEANYEESLSLTVTRDALLPKLLSGEVRPG